VAAPFVSIFGGCKPSIQNPFQAMIGGHLRHPYSATVEEVDEDVAKCLASGPRVSCYSHDVMQSITISNWTGTTTDCTSAIHAVMKSDKVFHYAPSTTYCSTSTAPLTRLYTITIDGGTYPSEVSVKIHDSQGTEIFGSGTTGSVVLNEGATYTITPYDTFGDGWTGAILASVTATYTIGGTPTTAVSIADSEFNNGKIGPSKTFTIPHTPQAKTWPTGVAGWSVWGDAAPLKVYDPMFVVRRISQETAEAGKRNTLTVSLVPSVRLVTGTRITISGLSAAIAQPGTVQLTVLEGPPLEARWICMGTMVVTVGDCIIFPGLLSVFQFSVVNNRPSRKQIGLPVSINATAGLCAGLSATPDEDFIYPFQRIHDPEVSPNDLRDDAKYGPSHKYFLTGTGIDLSKGVSEDAAKEARGIYPSIGCKNETTGDLNIPTMQMFLGTSPVGELERHANGVTTELDSSNVDTWPMTVIAPEFSKHRVWQTHAYPTFVELQTDVTYINTCPIDPLGRSRKRVGRARATAGIVSDRVDNTLHFEFAVNVAVPRVSYFHIQGLTGVQDDRDSIPFNAGSPSAGIVGDKFCNPLDGYQSVFEQIQNAASSFDVRKESYLCKDVQAGFAKWDNSRKVLHVFPLRDIVQGTMIKFSIDVDTYEEPTSALEIHIALLARNETCATTVSAEKQAQHSMDWDGKETAFQKMDYGMEHPTSEASCPLHIFNQRVLDTVPFYARVPKFLSVRMRQQHPWSLEMAQVGDGLIHGITGVGVIVSTKAHLDELNRQSRNWISTKLVANVPLNSHTKITLTNLVGRNFSEEVLATPEPANSHSRKLHLRWRWSSTSTPTQDQDMANGFGLGNFTVSVWRTETTSRTKWCQVRQGRRTRRTPKPVWPLRFTLALRALGAALTFLLPRWPSTSLLISESAVGML